jgi:regulatory protein
MPGSIYPSSEQNEVALAFRKAADYCAGQEHCTSEIRLKLNYWGFEKIAEQIISHLLDEGFIDELRYAKAFSRGKFRNLHWGRIKIKAQLRAKRIDTNYIAIALRDIDEQEYNDCLTALVKKKMHELGGPSVKNNFKAMRFALSKGFETELIQEVLRDRGSGN